MARPIARLQRLGVVRIGVAAGGVGGHKIRGLDKITVHVDLAPLAGRYLSTSPGSLATGARGCLAAIGGRRLGWAGRLILGLARGTGLGQLGVIDHYIGRHAVAAGQCVAHGLLVIDTGVIRVAIERGARLAPGWRGIGYRGPGFRLSAWFRLVAVIGLLTRLTVGTSQALGRRLAFGGGRPGQVAVGQPILELVDRHGRDGLIAVPTVGIVGPISLAGVFDAVRTEHRLMLIEAPRLVVLVDDICGIRIARAGLDEHIHGIAVVALGAAYIAVVATHF